MATNLITMVFSILAACLLIGSVSAFLLVVPAVTFAGVTVVLLALLLMFTLGIYAGGRRIRIRRHM
jgi:ABC-type transport system involved in Fe-S cluster assembly fused permease/ATPase subunit